MSGESQDRASPYDELKLAHEEWTTLNRQTLAGRQILHHERLEGEYAAFIGSRNLHEDTQMAILATLKHLPLEIGIVSGGCVGVDAFAAHAGFTMGRKVHVVLPGINLHIDELWWRYCTTWEQMPVGSSYRTRNLQVLHRTTDDVYAFAAHVESHANSRRSGTWMTVRLARRKGIDVVEWVRSTDV